MPAGQSLKNPIQASAAKAKPKSSSHATKSGHKCRCNMKPAHGSSKKGGWLNSAIPGEKGAIHNKRRIKHSGSMSWSWPIRATTPLLDGSGSGQVRGWVLGTVKDGKGFPYRVRINYGARKKMPPPVGVKLPGVPASTTQLVYYYAFSITMRGAARAPDGTLKPPPAKMKKIAGRGASGWIPGVCLREASKYRPKLECAGQCMERFDKTKHRAAFRKKRPKNPGHHLKCASPSVIKRLAKRYFTRVHQGKGADYVNRTPDTVSPCGYINMCYNLPDLRDSDGVNAGGVSCDTFPVGTRFYRIKKYADATMCNVKDQFIFKQRFYYGAVRYRTRSNPPAFAFKFGWIAEDAIGSGATMGDECWVKGSNGEMRKVACGGP